MPPPIPSGKRTAKYLIGEDVYLSPGNALRGMAKPATDHYTKRVSKGCTTPTGDNDQCGVHTDSGIMNQAFYLMAEGGTNPTSGIFVTGIGRETAEELFYLTLERGLTTTASFEEVARATVSWAGKLYGSGSEVALSVARAWEAVGVLTTNSLPTTVRQPNIETDRLLFYWADTPWGRTGVLNRAGDFIKQNQYYTFSTDWTWVAMGTNIFFYSSRTGAGAVGDIDDAGNFTTLRGFPEGFFYHYGDIVDPIAGRIRGGWSHITYHEGYLLFYDKVDGRAEIGRADASGYRTIMSYPRGTFGTGWTTIASTESKLLFYNANTGVAVVGDWNKSTNPLSFTDLKTYYNFSTGWTHIVDGGLHQGRPVGTLLYNTNTGSYTVGDIDEAGNLTMRTSTRWGYSTLGQGWTHITRVGQGLLFYNQWDGQLAVGHLLTRFECDGLRREPYRNIRSYIESSGYTHLTATLPR